MTHFYSCYACLIQDATACCQQGIEFQTTDEFDPSDYPAKGEPVTVLVDAPTPRENVTRFAQSQGYKVEVEDRDGEYLLKI